MTYQVVHRTTYKYKHPVSFGNHAVYLAPRSEAHQRCESYELVVTPPPATFSERRDYFGNRVSLFTIQEPHEELAIEARSMVTIDGEASYSPSSCFFWASNSASVSAPSRCRVLSLSSRAS